MFQQRIQDDYIELPEIRWKTCCVSDDPRENLGIRQGFPTLGACDEFRIKVNAGNFVAADCPVNTPRPCATSDVENGQPRRLSLWQELLEASILAVKFIGIRRRSNSDSVLRQIRSTRFVSRERSGCSRRIVHAHNLSGTQGHLQRQPHLEPEDIRRVAPEGEVRSAVFVEEAQLPGEPRHRVVGEQDAHGAHAIVARQGRSECDFGV